MSNDVVFNDNAQSTVFKTYASTPSEATLRNLIPEEVDDLYPSTGIEEAISIKEDGFLKRFQNDATLNLYFAKFLQAWGDRMWIFSIPILLMELTIPPIPQLFLPALYGFCSGVSTILFGPLMGEWVDRVPRLHAAKIVAICQNGSIAVAGILLAATIRWKSLLMNWQLYVLIVLIIACGFVSNIFYAGSVVILEKDWVVVIAKKDKDKLSGVISAIRRIELTTNILCPLLMAQIMIYAGSDITALLIGIWSIFSIGAEYLQMKRTWELSKADMEKQYIVKSIKAKKPLIRKLCKSCLVISAGWRTFIRNKISSAAMSIAFFEATVLVFSGVTNSYAVSQGLSRTTVALLAGGDALTGIVGTFIFPIIRYRISLEAIALVSMVFHFLCGSVSVGSNWLPGSPFDPTFLTQTKLDSVNPSLSLSTSTPDVSMDSMNLLSLIVFSVTVTFGRFAFWMIDLSGSQLILENIHDNKRATICAVHYSLKKLLNRVRYVLAMIFSSPQTFGFLIIFSQVFNMVGYALFIYYCVSNRQLETEAVKKKPVP